MDLMANMSHAKCTHPRTPAGRAACRKAGGPGLTVNVAVGLSLRDPAEIKLAEIRALAIRLMSEYNLVGWSFAWDRSPKRFGQCRFGVREIGISRSLAAANEVGVVEDTIRHEIAHALVGPGHGHDAVWQDMAVRIGARPNRYYDRNEVNPGVGAWIGTCPNGHTVVIYRLTPRWRNSACILCCRAHNGGVFSSRFMFSFAKKS